MNSSNNIAHTVTISIVQKRRFDTVEFDITVTVQRGRAKLRRRRQNPPGINTRNTSTKNAIARDFQLTRAIAAAAAAGIFYQVLINVGNFDHVAEKYTFCATQCGPYSVT